MALESGFELRLRTRLRLASVFRWAADQLREEVELSSGTVAASVQETAAPDVADKELPPEDPSEDNQAFMDALSHYNGSPRDFIPPSEPSGPAPVPSAHLSVEDQVVEMLHTVFDPEIPVDIYDLGLIYGVDIQDTGHTLITMTLTSPNCPAAQSLPAEVETKVGLVDGIGKVEVEIVFDPPWTPDLMTEEARLELNL